MAISPQGMQSIAHTYQVKAGVKWFQRVFGITEYQRPPGVDLVLRPEGLKHLPEVGNSTHTWRLDKAVGIDMCHLVGGCFRKHTSFSVAFSSKCFWSSCTFQSLPWRLYITRSRVRWLRS
ncbi:hypothetical protein ACKS0A_03762 [Histoplasma ohiense]